MENSEVKAPASRIEWLKERQKGVGGSDVAAILGMNPYRTALEVWQDKTTPITEDKGAGEAAHWGTILEDAVAREFMQRTGLKIQRVNRNLARGEDGWMRANIDRAIVRPEIRGNVRVADDGFTLTTDTILECKTASTYKADEWGDSQLDEIIAGNVVTDHKIPLYYETQVQWYLGVTGCSLCYVAVLIGGQSFRVYEVKADPDLFAALEEKCRAFWFENVKKNVPPAPANAADVRRLFEKDNGVMAEASNEEAADIGELARIKGQIKQLEEEEKAVSSRVIFAIAEKAGLTIKQPTEAVEDPTKTNTDLKALKKEITAKEKELKSLTERRDSIVQTILDSVGGSASLTINGVKAATYKAMVTSRFSSTKFKAAHPDTYKEFCSESVTRVLRVA